MKLVDLDISQFDSFLKIHDLENFFDVRVDQKGNRVFSLNKTVYVDADYGRLPEFVCDQTMHWPLISYRLYGTTRLVWLLWKLNNVKAEDMFKAKQPKDIVKYLPQPQSDSLVADINEFE